MVCDWKDPYYESPSLWVCSEGLFVVMGVIDKLGMHYPAFFLKKIAKTTQTMIPTAYCVLRRSVATDAFASGHAALPVAGVNRPLSVRSLQCNVSSLA